MKAIETVYKKKYDCGVKDYRVRVKLIPDKKLSCNKDIDISIGEGEPEDMILSRDLNDAYYLLDLIRLAHAAGAAGESLIIQKNIEEEV